MEVSWKCHGSVMGVSWEHYGSGIMVFNLITFTRHIYQIGGRGGNEGYFSNFIIFEYEKCYHMIF